MVILIGNPADVGHWHVGTTMRYVTQSAMVMGGAFQRAVSGALVQDWEETGSAGEVGAAPDGRGRASSKDRRWPPPHLR